MRHSIAAVCVAVAALASLAAPLAAAPSAPGLRVAVAAFENRSPDPRVKSDQSSYLARMVQERLGALSGVQVLPRPKQGAFPKDADYLVRGDYLALANGHYCLSLRLVEGDGGVIGAWADEAPSWRAMIMDSRDLSPLEREEVNAFDRQAPGDRPTLRVRDVSA